MLARAGADFGILASNRPHIVFDALHERSSLPLLSIVTVTCDAARAAGYGRLGLFGTRFTMQGRFYADVFARSGIELVAPTLPEQATIHAIYMTELVNGIMRDESRSALLAIVQRLKTEEGIDGVILGGTELPLLLRDGGVPPVPFLDTTQLHVEQVVARLLS
jgi:aspartate racemase